MSFIKCFQKIKWVGSSRTLRVRGAHNTQQHWSTHKLSFVDAVTNESCFISKLSPRIRHRPDHPASCASYCLRASYKAGARLSHVAQSAHTSPTGRPVPARLIDVNRVHSHTPYVAMGRGQSLLPWATIGHSVIFLISLLSLSLSPLRYHSWHPVLVNGLCAALDLEFFLVKRHNSIVFLEWQLQERSRYVSSAILFASESGTDARTRDGGML